MSSTNNANGAAAPTLDKVQTTVRSTEDTKRHVEVDGDLSLRTRKDREGVAPATAQQSSKAAHNPTVPDRDPPDGSPNAKRKRVAFVDKPEVQRSAHFEVLDKYLSVAVNPQIKDLRLLLASMKPNDQKVEDIDDAIKALEPRVVWHLQSRKRIDELHDNAQERLAQSILAKGPSAVCTSAKRTLAESTLANVQTFRNIADCTEELLVWLRQERVRLAG